MIMIDKFQIEHGNGNTVNIVDKQTNKVLVIVDVSIRKKYNLVLATNIINNIIVPYFENGENYETD